MKKFLALMLALALLAVSAVGLAEDAAETADAVESSSYAAVSFQDPVLTVTENGEETSYDLTGLSLSFEGILNDAASWLVATLSGPDGAAAALTAQMDADGQLTVALDGVSKALTVNAKELFEAFMSELPEDEAAMIQAAMDGDMTQLFDIEGALTELQSMFTVENIEEPQEIEFISGTKQAYGTRVVIPREALEYIVSFLGETLEAGDEFDAEIDGDLYAQDNADPEVDSIDMVMWHETDDNAEFRFDITVKMDDESEVPVVLLLAVDDVEETGSFEGYVDGEQMLDGSFEADDHSVTVTMTIPAADEEADPMTIVFEAGETQSEGSEEYDAFIVSLTFVQSEEDYMGMELYLCDTDDVQSFSFSVATNEGTAAVGYDGTSEYGDSGEKTTDGTLFFILTDGGEPENSIVAQISVVTLSGLEVDTTPDLSGMTVLTMDDLENVGDDAEMTNELMNVMVNAMSELAKIPVLSELLAGETGN